MPTLIKRTDWQTIPVGSILKVTLIAGDPIYGLVREVLKKQYALFLLMLAANMTCMSFHKLSIGYVQEFEIMPVEDLPLIVGYKHTKKALSDLLKGLSPAEIFNACDFDYYHWKVSRLF